MKGFTIFIFLALFIQTTVSAQSCLPDGITFSSQSEIDNFQTNYPNCTEIEGDVEINGDDITNLNGLNVLTAIGGYLSIVNNDTLTSLSGLDNLTSIGGVLSISENDILVNITGLDYITSVVGGISISYNAALTSLNGFEALISTAGDLQISGNISLTNLVALGNLTSIGGDLHIGGDWELGDGNPSLTSLIGLDNVVYIGGDLIIAENNALTSLTGLENLNSIEGSLLIGIYGFGGWNQDGNDALISLTGLDNVTSIGGNILILANPVLTSLTGLDNIEAESIEDLTIVNNPYLSHCSVLSICNYLGNPNGDIYIEDNTTGCNSPDEVQDSCEANAIKIDEQFIADKILLYPNPSSTQITIELPTTPQKNTLLTIYTLNGQQFITQPVTELQTVVEVSGLPSGIYYIKVMDSERVMMGKVVKN